MQKARAVNVGVMQGICLHSAISFNLSPADLPTAMAALASKRPQMPAPVGQGASGIRGSVLLRGGAPFVFRPVELSPSTAVNHIGPRILLVRDQRERTWPGDKAGIQDTSSAEPCTVARPPLSLTTMPGSHIVLVVGAIGMAVFASPSAFASDVREMTCAEIAAFAQQVAQQNEQGRALNDIVRRLHRSFGRRNADADTEHELERIVRAIFRVPIFSAVSPEQVGSEYQTACEHG